MNCRLLAPVVFNFAYTQLLKDRRKILNPDESATPFLFVRFNMRNFGHEKNSQHAFIKSVILRQSFLSAMKRIISTRAIGMCPCGYLTACLH